MKATIQRLALVSGPAVAAILVLFFDISPGHPAVTRAAAIALWMALWWITEAIPLGGIHYSLIVRSYKAMYHLYLTAK